MNNYTTDSYEVKREIVNFSRKLSKGLSKPKSKFVMDMLYGISKGKSLLVSDIARALDEFIKLGNTIERLCDNASSFDKEHLIMNNYHNEIKDLFPKMPTVIFDDTDITKRYGKKFEDLCYVRDGSSTTEEILPGYHVCEAVALTKQELQPISLYSKIYSSKSNGFKSVNDETLESINAVRDMFKRPFLGVFDRYYDADVFYKELVGSEDKFIIRLRDRYLLFKGKRRKVKQVAKERKGKISMKFPFEEFEVKISYTKVKLPDYAENLQLVIIYGINDKEPMMLLTNILENDKESIIKIAKSYLYRWRVEEYFRVKKQVYGFENMRVRTLKSMNTLNLMITLTLGHNGKLIEKKDKKLLTLKIIERSKSLRDKVCTWYYQLARGIYNILAYAKTGVKEYQKIEKRTKPKQLVLLL